MLLDEYQLYWFRRCYQSTEFAYFDKGKKKKKNTKRRTFWSKTPRHSCLASLSISCRLCFESFPISIGDRYVCLSLCLWNGKIDHHPQCRLHIYYVRKCTYYVSSFYAALPIVIRKILSSLNLCKFLFNEISQAVETVELQLINNNHIGMQIENVLRII